MSKPKRSWTVDPPVIDITPRCPDCGGAFIPVNQCKCSRLAGTVLRPDAPVARCRAKNPYWLPNGDPELGVRDVHGRGWTSAHAGTVSDRVRDESDVEARFAGLTSEERELVPLLAAELRTARVAPGTYARIGAALRLSLRQVESRVASIRRKVREAGEALRAGSMHA